MRRPIAIADEPEPAITPDNPLLTSLEMMRLSLAPQMNRARNAQWGQYFTPARLAHFMASLAEMPVSSITLLDAGAGVGTLFGAAIATLCARGKRPERIHVLAYEIDATLIPYLHTTANKCRELCESAGIRFTADIREDDFIEDAVTTLQGGLFSARSLPPIHCAILNPPYTKIRSTSQHRKLLREAGVETSNLYTGFLALAIQLLQPQGELVAITPRSFCNGPYFRPFRQQFLNTMRLQRLHLFDSREIAFGDDGVLQENLIMRATKRDEREPIDANCPVIITTSNSPDDEVVTQRIAPYNQVVHSDDPQSFIHIVPDDIGQNIRTFMDSLPCDITALGLSVSTGRVVEFRARDVVRHEVEPGAVPLIQPAHLREGLVDWPGKRLRRPVAIVADQRSRSLLVPNENYVLVKRVTAKEESRRVVAAVYQAQMYDAEFVGFENHLNYFHRNGSGVSLELARGLAAFLNSTLVDASFRLFNGHTQVNATDLRSIRYPTNTQLEAIGRQVGDRMPEQSVLDSLVTKELHLMADTGKSDPVLAKQRIEEARTILALLGMPDAQQNERSALALLALLGLREHRPESPLLSSGG